MRLLILSDIHGNTANLAMLHETSEVDAIVCAGDFACLQQPESGLTVLHALVKKNDTVFAVLGNCDSPDFVEELENLDVNIQGTLVYRGGLFFAGSGGAIRFSSVTPNERAEEELLADLHMIDDAEKSGEANDWHNLIVVSHHPPHNTKVDFVSSGFHVGSQSLRTFVEKHHPLMCISGHIHEAAAVDTLGKTTLINPGSLADGKYAIAELKETNGNWQVISAELRKL